ncbi:transcriptional regulator, MerR family [Formosa agariphila KMM 3901]|uniref:Transcriptional regulator, MerR family n=1 Tax=Formosa agariphila (strain DSM 15362 / KCTC 12365 / LMG 23005 / KMM 3901 / M-2Alg 35-1) TaxID=1347342 RepID=T2KJD2_FORAG|nr:chaperone modulator CbpM [Formosa agariphila]CDF78997.1 transcriptional regulator, MerR family [Formosa agariphila KMM 3901]
MAENHYILVRTICVQYKIEPVFLEDLQGIGLVDIITIENDKFLHQDTLADLEKMIRLHNELNVNLEGIDVVFNLLKKVNTLQQELSVTKNKLLFYENQ